MTRVNIQALRRANNKYGAEATVIDGIRFDSKKEANRYAELKLMEKGKLITDLKLQPRFELQAAFTDRRGNKHRKIEYVADFTYWEYGGGHIIEDVKGCATDMYKLKKKLFLFKYPNYNFIET